MATGRSRIGVPFWIIVALAVGMTVIAALSAHRAFGRAFPSFLYDPSGSYSLVDMPHWKNDGLRLSRVSRIVAVDGASVGGEVGYLRFPGSRIASMLDSTITKRSSAVVTLQEGAHERILESELRKFGSIEILLLCVAYLCFGWFALLTVLLLRESVGDSGSGLGSLTACVGLAFAFLAGFLDFHTNGWLFPVFQFANIGTPLALFLLCFDYPFPVVMWRPFARFVRWAAVTYFVVAVFDQVLMPIVGVPPTIAPDSIDVVTKLSFLSTGFVIIVRMVRGKGEERASFVAIGIANGAAILLLGAGITLSLAFGLELLGFTVNILLPLVPTMFVMGFCYSVVRHNLLAVRTILGRSPLRAPALFLSCALAVGGYTLASFWANHQPGFRLLDGWLLLSLAGGIYWLIRRGIERLLFPAAGSYRTSISDLGDYVAGVRCENSIAQALRKTVAELLPHHVIEILIDGKSESGEGSGTGGSETAAFPMLANGTIYGMIAVRPGRRSPFLTVEDVNLVRMVATVGAIGISNARSLNALEEIHSQNMDLTRKENLLSLQVFGAEISHEIQYPITYFKYLLEELRSHRRLDQEDVELGSDEIRRLERMVQSMKRFQHPSMELRHVNVLETARRVMILLKDLLAKHGVVPVVRIPQQATLLADRNLLIQILSNVLKNAVEAASEPKLVELGLEAFDDGSCAIIVRDSGPGLPDMDVFSPWVSTKSEGRGIGLTVCQRIAREMRWEIEASRELQTTRFSIKIPKESVLMGEGVMT